MPQYIMLVNFTDQGLKGVKEVPNRQDRSRATAMQFGVERKSVWMTSAPMILGIFTKRPTMKRWRSL
jgi:uncharacterized protein with GYD domain